MATLKGGRLCVSPLLCFLTFDFGSDFSDFGNFGDFSDFSDFSNFGGRPLSVLPPPYHPTAPAWVACAARVGFSRTVAWRAHNSYKIVSFVPKSRFCYKCMKLHYKNKIGLNWCLKPNKCNVQNCPLPTAGLNRSEMRLFCPVCRFCCAGGIGLWLQKKSRPKRSERLQLFVLFCKFKQDPNRGKQQGNDGDPHTKYLPFYLL